MLQLILNVSRAHKKLKRSHENHSEAVCQKVDRQMHPMAACANVRFSHLNNMRKSAVEVSSVTILTFVESGLMQV